MKRDILQSSGVTVLTNILPAVNLAARQEIIQSDPLRQMVANLDSVEYDCGAPANCVTRYKMVDKRDEQGNKVLDDNGKVIKERVEEEYLYTPDPGPLKDLVDVFCTIDSINTIITDETAPLILGRYRPGDYQVLQDLKTFVRPKKMVPAAFSNGLVAENCEDMLETHKFDNSDMGEELTPIQFMLAQTNLVRFINPRFNVANCEFVDVVINDQAETETIHLETPVVMPDGTWKTASHMSTLRLFPIKYHKKSLVDSYYAIDVVDDYEELLVKLFLHLSGLKASGNGGNN